LSLEAQAAVFIDKHKSRMQRVERPTDVWVIIALGCRFLHNRMIEAGQIKKKESSDLIDF